MIGVLSVLDSIDLSLCLLGGVQILCSKSVHSNAEAFITTRVEKMVETFPIKGRKWRSKIATQAVVNRKKTALTVLNWKNSGINGVEPGN